MGGNMVPADMPSLLLERHRATGIHISKYRVNGSSLMENEKAFLI